MSSFFLGKLLRDMREERMMSVNQLSSISGLSQSQIIRMENGKIPLLSLFKFLRSFSQSSQFNTKDPYVSHAKESDKYASVEGNMKYCPLIKGDMNHHMTPFILQIFDKEWSNVNKDNSGEDFIYVLSGAIEITYGTKKYHLLPGDSIYFDSSIEHSVKNIDDDYSKLLIVLY